MWYGYPLQVFQSVKFLVSICLLVPVFRAFIILSLHSWAAAAFAPLALPGLGFTGAGENLQCCMRLGMQLLPCGCNKGSLPGEWWACWSVAVRTLASIWIDEVGGQQSWEIYGFTANKDIFFSYLNHTKFIESNAATLLYPEGLPVALLLLWVGLFALYPPFFSLLLALHPLCLLTCWILTAVIAVEEGMKHWNKLSPNSIRIPISIQLVNAVLDLSVQMCSTKQITTLVLFLKLSGGAWINKTPWIINSEFRKE